MASLDPKTENGKSIGTSTMGAQHHPPTGTSSIDRPIDCLTANLSEQVKQYSDADLECFHARIEEVSRDLDLLGAIRKAQRTLNPGDILTYEEAIQFLANYDRLASGTFDAPIAVIAPPDPARSLEIRYCRSFLLDLKRLDLRGYQSIHQIVFFELNRIEHLWQLPALQPLTSNAILYRFRLESHSIGLEMTGGILKFLRIL